MIKNYIYLLALLFLVACNNELDLVEDWKDIPIVYGILDPSDSAHYIRIEKAFIDREISGLEIAKIADSLYYDDVEAYLENKGQLHKLTKVDGESEGFPRNEGVFATVPNYLYKLSAEALDLQGDEQITFRLRRSGDLAEVTASTRTIGEYYFLRPNPDDPDKLYLNYTNDFDIRWKNAPNAVEYDVFMIINYDEKLITEPDNAYVEKQVTWKAAAGVEDNEVEIESRDFYNFLATAIEEDNQKIRRFSNVDFRVVAVGVELSDYTAIGGANLGITASQEIPKYTNLTEGYGIISSKWEIEVSRIRVVQETRDSINEGIYTKHLNFQY
jgi:hypothetical protein